MKRCTIKIEMESDAFNLRYDSQLSELARILRTLAHEAEESAPSREKWVAWDENGNVKQARDNYLKTLEMLAKSRLSIAVHADNLRSIIERPEASDDHRERAARLLVAATA